MGKTTHSLPACLSVQVCLASLRGIPTKATVHVQTERRLTGSLQLTIMKPTSVPADHFIVWCRPATCGSDTDSTSSTSSEVVHAAWEQLLIRVPLGYPQEHLGLVFPRGTCFTSCCQVKSLAAVMKPMFVRREFKMQYKASNACALLSFLEF